MSTDPTTLSVVCAAIAANRTSSIGIVCIDGPAGSGKTTLSAQIAQELNAQVVHMDDLYEGWEGVGQAPHYLESNILAPLFRGEPAGYHRYDWPAAARAEWHDVPQGEWLIVEGCASATRIVDKYEPFIIWVEAPDDTRLARGLERDGEELRPQWLQFMADETAIYQQNDTKARAHLRLDGYGNIVS